MRWFEVAVALGAAFGPGCSCSGNGHIEPSPFVARPGDDVVNCNCNLSFANEHCTDHTCAAHFSIQLCLPRALQAAPSTDMALVPDAGIGTDDYSRAIDAYCRTTVRTTIEHVITTFNGNWCDYKKPYAPDGGIGDSIECFAEHLQDGQLAATGHDDGTCETPCASVECDFDTNCGTDVEDQYGNIYLDRCKCSEITTRACPDDDPHDLPLPVFCRPPKDVSIR